MRSRIPLSSLLLVPFLLAEGCSTAKDCPVCGTTVNDGYGLIDVIPVPEHNPTGEPGGPFNSFDISVTDSVNHRFFVSDRIGLDVVVVDTINNVAVNAIGGANSVAQGGNNASPCVTDAAGNDVIPPILTALGNFTRYGCRTAIPGGVKFGIPGFGANHLFGGFPGAQCCAARANGVNPLSAPDGEVVTPDGRFLFIGNGSSSVVVFDLSTMDVTQSPPIPPTVIATIPTGQSADYDGGPNPGSANPNGIAPCIASANGRAFADPTCGDLRADEMSYDPKDGILLVANGDPGLPFVTLIDVSGVIAGTSHCLPVNPSQAYGPTNFPSCILGQIYYDNAFPVDNTVAVDSANGFACPDPSNGFFNGNPVPSGVSGKGVGPGGRDIPCHHGPVLTFKGAPFGAVAVAGIGGSAFNPNTGHFLVTNSNATADLTVGTIDEIDPGIGTTHGPVVVNSFPVPNCMPASIVQGPGNNFLVGCGDHDGVAFPPNEYVIDGSTGEIRATINNVGGVDETWYNPHDNRYYLAARDMPGGAVLGVIDAKTNLWLQSVPTGSNSHSVAVDSNTDHVFVPLQAGPRCTTQSANGCIGVYARQ